MSDALEKKVEPLTEAETREALKMLTEEYEDETIGRLSHGLDVSDFDVKARNRIDDTPIATEGGHGDELDLLSGDDVPAMFSSPDEPFPTFKRALTHFKANEPASRVLRIDTPETHEKLVCDAACKELERRTNELRAALEEHESDHHGLSTPMRKWDVLGAAEAVKNIAAAASPKEAMAAMPKIPLNIPANFEGSIHCWQDGENVICSIKFETPAGGRIATMATKPRVDADEVAHAAIQSGMDPTTVLGCLPQLANMAAGQRLVKTVAGAALDVQRRLDVCGMSDEPILLVSIDEDSSAPLAALMYVEQAAQNGDEQAQKEISMIQQVAQTPAGQALAAPMVNKSTALLQASKSVK